MCGPNAIFEERYIFKGIDRARAADAIFEEGKCPSYILKDIQR